MSRTSAGTTGTVSRFRTPDGGTIVLDVPGYDLSDPWSAVVTVTANDPFRVLPTNRQVRGFALAFRGNYDLVIEKVLHGKVVERFSNGGGEILLARGPEQAIVLWRGQWHEAAMWLSDPDIDTAQAISVFEGLTFVDDPLGLRVRTENPETEIVETTEVVKYVPGVGYLDIKTSAAGIHLVPKWSGARTRAGEVWRSTHEATAAEPAASILIHATPSTVTVLNGDGQQKSDEAPRVEFLNQLAELSWITT